MAAVIPGAWQNWIGDHPVSAFRGSPTTKDELISAVELAARSGRRIRAVGSGHSFSSCAKPRSGQSFLDLSGLSGPFEEVKWLRPDPPGLASGERLIRVKAGTRLKTFNRVILPGRRPALAIINMGTFDGQTLAGAISTGTHGTGTRLGSLADLVVSMDVVTVTRGRDGQPHVQMARVEPTDGVTDRAAFNRDRAEHGMVLYQEDDIFHSMVVSYGCMGVAFAYTMKVRPAYWLRLEDDLLNWRRLRDDLKQTRAVPGVGAVPAVEDEDRHFSFLLNVAEMQGKKAVGDPVCLLTRRNIVPADDEPKLHTYRWPPERVKDSIFEWFAGFFNLNTPDPVKDHDDLGETLRKKYFEREAKIEPFAGNRTASANYIALRRDRDAGKPDEAPKPPPNSISAEIAVPADRVVDALDAALDAIQRHRFFFAVPLGVRFTAPSKHYLSVAYGRATAFIEVAMVLSTSRLDGERLDRDEMRDRIAKPALADIERRLCYEGERLGRPHLGKQHSLTRERLQAMFPRFEAWLATYRRFNAFGTFDNAFTDQLGLTGEGRQG